MAHAMPLARLLADYRPGSFDPPWSSDDEVQWMITTQPGYLAGLALNIASQGIRTPVRLHHGERRVWDGHHRVVIAVLLRLPEVPWADARYSDTGRLVT